MLDPTIHQALARELQQSQRTRVQVGHRGHHRPRARRSAGARVLLGRDARGRRDRRAHRLPHRAERGRPPRDHRQARRLQDLDAAGRRGRPIELDAIVTAVHEIGTRVGQTMPNIGALLGLARLFGRVHGRYPEAGA